MTGPMETKPTAEARTLTDRAVSIITAASVDGNGHLIRGFDVTSALDGALAAGATKPEAIAIQTKQGAVDNRIGGAYSGALVFLEGQEPRVG